MDSIVEHSQKARYSSLNSEEQCFQSDFITSSTDDFILKIKNSSKDCMDVLWNLSSSLNQIYTKENTLALLSELKPLLNSLNDEYLLKLIRVLRIGFYHQSYKTISIEDAEFLIDDYRGSLLTLISNIPIDKYSEHSLLVRYTTQGIDAASKFTGEFLPFLLSQISTYTQTPTLIDEYENKVSIYVVMALLQRMSGSPEYLNSIQTNFFDTLRNLAKSSYIRENNPSTFSNVAFICDRVKVYTNYYITDSKKDFLVNSCNTLIDEMIPLVEEDSEQYLWVIKAATVDQDCFDSNTIGKTICKEDMQKKISANVLPYEYKYSDEKITVKTSLPKEQIDDLVEKMMNVKKNFHSSVGFYKPVPGDEGEELICVIYGTKSDYQTYHNFLTDLPTNNGGIYIERDATFYTYERTPQESTYTLEELTMHEVVHYYMGRYVIPGLWGGDLHKGGVLTFLEEGIAEAISGSDENGIYIRESIVSKIERDNEARMTINEVFDSRYGAGFKFYRYAGAFFANLIKNDLNQFDQFMSSLREQIDHYLIAFLIITEMIARTKNLIMIF